MLAQPDELIWFHKNQHVKKCDMIKKRTIEGFTLLSAWFRDISSEELFSSWVVAVGGLKQARRQTVRKESWSGCAICEKGCTGLVLCQEKMTAVYYEHMLTNDLNRFLDKVNRGLHFQLHNASIGTVKRAKGLFGCHVMASQKRWSYCYSKYLGNINHEILS